MADICDVEVAECDGPAAMQPTSKALSCILDAWEEGLDSGVAPEMMAYAALYAAFADLVNCYGEQSVANLVEGLAPRIRRGDFTLYDTVQ